jgi:hypothetical protein
VSTKPGEVQLFRVQNAISHLASVVIREFNNVGIPIFKSETYAPLVVDGNRVLPLFPERGETDPVG